MKKFRTLLLVAGIVILMVGAANGQIPAGYYTSANGLTGFTLKTALYNIIKGHTSVSYDDLYTYYAKTDAKPGNVVWDMYSDNPSGTPAYIYHHVSSDQCGSYNSEADCYNREHSFPASWFNDGTPMYSDLFLVVPTDGYVNNRRSNYPFGDVGTASWTSTNGSKLGNCSYPGYSGTVFEPIDAYKGDFARSMFYIVTRYENVIATWYSNTTEAGHALTNNNTVCFQTWYLNMLYQWHVDDPVSTKEIARNDSVYKIQHNRNPYIDHPEWVAVVWNMPTTASETQMAQQIHIAPNPSTDYLEISFPEQYTFSKIWISDITGRLVSSVPVPQTYEKIDVRGLEKGLYFIVFQSPNGSFSQRFIKN